MDLKAVVKTVELKLSQIKPYWRNPRKNSETVKMIKQSINDFGFHGALLIDKNNVIVNGHARYRALIELGYKSVSCEIFTGTEAKAKEFRIADNKIHEATGWDDEQLKLELRELDIASMQQYFPEMDLQLTLSKDVDIAGGFGATEEKVGTVMKRMDKAQSDLAQKDQDRKIDIMCPHCLETFFVNKDDII